MCSEFYATRGRLISVLEDSVSVSQRPADISSMYLTVFTFQVPNWSRHLIAVDTHMGYCVGVLIYGYKKMLFRARTENLTRLQPLVDPAALLG